MSRVLVTGATGFIGSQCVSQLVEAGYEVHAVAPEGSHPDDAGVTWHCADLLEPVPVQRLLSEIRPTHLLHLAWFVAPGEFWSSTENLRWLKAGIDLATAFAERGGQRCVIAGTCAEYEETSELLVEGVTPLRPTTLYGACKAALHLSTASYFAERGVSAAWGHIFNLYGPREHPDRLVPSLARALTAGRTFTCHHPSDVRDFLHVEDVASAFVALLGSGVTGDVNIASGVPTTVGRLVSMVADVVERPGLVDYRVEVPQESRIVGDNRRLTREVGWSPRFGLRDGLEDAVRWWLNEHPDAAAREGGTE